MPPTSFSRELYAKLPIFPFLVAQFSPPNKQAIADSKPSRTLGRDGFCNFHLKHLGPLAPGYLTNLCSLSLSDNNILQFWKNSKVNSLPKPEKDYKIATLYRPFSLIKCARCQSFRETHPCLFNKAPPKYRTPTWVPPNPLYHNRTLHL